MPEAVDLDLDHKHPFYLAVDPVRMKARDLYDGSAAVKAKTTDYLPATQNESKEQYSLRLFRAVYDNYIEVVASARQSLLWNRPPRRTGFADPFDLWIEDVDGLGMNADDYFKERCAAAEVDGTAFTLVDKPTIPQAVREAQRLPDGSYAPLSIAQEAQYGLRPYFVRIAARDVFDWQWGEDRLLDWVVIRECYYPPHEPGVEVKPIERRRIRRRATWTLYEAQQFPAGVTGIKPKWMEKDFGVNDLGEVGLVCHYGSRCGPFYGVPVVKDVLDHEISIYNKFSDRDVGEFQTNNPITVIISQKKPDRVDVGYGIGMWVESIPGVQSSVSYLETSANGVQSSRESERDLIRRIFEIALRQAKRDSAQVQSDESMKMEGRYFTASLTSVANRNEGAERECWRLMAKWQRFDSFAGEVVYAEDFDDKVIDAVLLGRLSDMQARGQLSLETLLNEMNTGEIIHEDGWTPELERERIAQDADEGLNMKDFQGGNRPPDTTQDQPPPVVAVQGA